MSKDTVNGHTISANFPRQKPTRPAESQNVELTEER